MNKAQALMNKQVIVTESGVQGKVVDWTDNGLTVWIERATDGDWITARVIEVTLVADQEPTMGDKFEDALKQHNIEWDGYTEFEAVTYCIEGCKYGIMVTLEGDGTFSMHTTHIERQSNIEVLSDESAQANDTTRKTLKGAMNYIHKYMDL